MSMNLQKKIGECLRQNIGKGLSTKEISSWVLKNYPKECLEKLSRSENLKTKDDLLKQLSAEISARLIKDCPFDFEFTTDRPRRYLIKTVENDSKTSSQERPFKILCEKKDSPKRDSLLESDLYPLLSSFLFSKLKIYSKRVNEKRSRKSVKGNNDWLYPDIVGVENFSDNWHNEVKNCVQKYSDKKTKLWSFEVKVLLSRSTVRKCFFQTVSNSSWANWSYLVCSTIENPENTLKELRILSSLHGIGLIHLNVENPQNSQIVIPAKEHTDIDWDTVNRLAEENSDFLEYIKLISEFYLIDKFRKSDWDI